MSTLSTLLRSFSVALLLSAPLAVGCANQPVSEGDEAADPGEEVIGTGEELIIDENGGTCTLTYSCNKACTSAQKMWCSQYCGGNMNMCYTECYADGKTDCCDFMCI